MNFRYLALVLAATTFKIFGSQIYLINESDRETTVIFAYRRITLPANSYVALERPMQFNQIKWQTTYFFGQIQDENNIGCFNDSKADLVVSFKRDGPFTEGTQESFLVASQDDSARLAFKINSLTKIDKE